MPLQRGGAAYAPAREPRLTGPQKLLAGLWILILFDPQWLLAAYGLSPALKLPVLLFALLLLTLILGVPVTRAWSKRWIWFAPFLAYIACGAVTLPWAGNNGYARQALQLLLLYWTLIVATVALTDSVKRIEQLLYLYGFQFLWWGLWASMTGLVYWHFALNNYDGYGAFAVGGLGICYFLAMATTDARFRKLMYFTAALCALGVVASFARGAFLAAAALFVVIWLRSPKKGSTLVFAVVGAVVVIFAAEKLHPENSFWAEIMSTFEEGTDEGTGEDRWELWMAALEVYKQNPVFGVGPRNFGVFASEYFKPGDIGGMYANNPRILYDRSVHSLYFTTLAELGTMGMLALIWIVVDFWRRNRALRTEAAQRAWSAMGGKFMLKPVALGLEASMVAFLTTAAIYPMAGIHWFYTMLAVNLILHQRIKKTGAFPARPRRVIPTQPAPAPESGATAGPPLLWPG